MVAGGDAVLVVGAVAGAAIVNELIKVIFARMRTSDFVLKSSCKECKGKENAKIDAIAKLTLAMAIKMGIDTSEIAKLLGN